MEQKELIIQSIGRRKSAIARVFLKPGVGKVIINDKNLVDYFTYSLDQNQVVLPLLLFNLQTSFGCLIMVEGGGRTGQIGAIKLGLARALCVVDPNYRSTLKQYGLLRRDARIKERRKYGLKKARKASQYSKR